MSSFSPDDALAVNAGYEFVVGGQTAAAAAAAFSWVRANVVRECSTSPVENMCTDAAGDWWDPRDWFGAQEPVCRYSGLYFPYAGVVLGRARTDDTVGQVLERLRKVVPSAALLVTPRDTLGTDARCAIEEATTAIVDRAEKVVSAGGAVIDVATGSLETAAGIGSSMQGVLGVYFGSRGVVPAVALWAASGLLVWKVGPMVLTGVERTAAAAAKVAL